MLKPFYFCRLISIILSIFITPFAFAFDDREFLVCNEPEKANFIGNHVFLNQEHQFEAITVTADLDYNVTAYASEQEALMRAGSSPCAVNVEGFLEAHRPEYPRAMSRIQNFIETSRLPLSLQHRFKSFASLKEKVFRKIKQNGRNFRLSSIHDIIGLRLVAPNTILRNTTSEAVAAFLGRSVLKKEERFNADSGYRAIHIDAISDATPYELQINTQRMVQWDAWQHDRVYKPRSLASLDLLASLERYGRDLATVIHSLDNETPETDIVWPDHHDYGLSEEDQFLLNPL